LHYFLINVRNLSQTEMNAKLKLGGRRRKAGCRFGFGWIFDFTSASVGAADEEGCWWVRGMTNPPGGAELTAVMGR
jgi:hypothetical protein